jgi:hypothetical protein
MHLHLKIPSPKRLPACSVGWCWFVLREEYCWLVAGGWFVLREKYCSLVADKPSEQAERAILPRPGVLRLVQFSVFSLHPSGQVPSVSLFGCVGIQSHARESKCFGYLYEISHTRQKKILKNYDYDFYFLQIQFRSAYFI